MQKIFKLNDKVYCPNLGNKIYVLKDNTKYSSTYTLAIETLNGEYSDSCTPEGFIRIEDKTASIFKVTEKNRINLEKLYNTSFDKLPSILDTNLNQGIEVLCLISKQPIPELPNKVYEVKPYIKIKVVTHKLRENNYRLHDSTTLQSWHLYPISIDNSGTINYL